MIGAVLCEAIQAALQGAFPDVYVGLPQDNDRITMPAIILELRSDAVVGSPLERGTLTVLVASQADDTAPAAHAQFVADVGAFMRTLTIDSDAVQLHDCCAPLLRARCAHVHQLGVRRRDVGAPQEAAPGRRGELDRALVVLLAVEGAQQVAQVVGQGGADRRLERSKRRVACGRPKGGHHAAALVVVRVQPAEHARAQGGH